MTGFRILRLVLLECALAMAFLCAVGTPSSAEEVEFKGELTWPPGADPRAMRLFSLYAAYCVIPGPDSKAQSDALEQSGMELLAGNLAAFLGKEPGKVWGASDATGGFAIAISEVQGCTVYAEHVPVADAERLFEYLSSNMPIMILPPVFQPQALTKIGDELSDDQLTHLVRYKCDLPDSDFSIWFTLATFQNPKASAQAFANLILVRRKKS